MLLSTSTERPPPCFQAVSIMRNRERLTDQRVYACPTYTWLIGPPQQVKLAGSPYPNLRPRGRENIRGGKHMGVDTAQMVRDALAFDGRINEANLLVRYGEGVVTLSGVLFSEQEKEAAEDIARHIPGVERVVNEILVMKVTA